MVFVEVIATRSGAWDDAGEEQDRGRLPGRPFRGYHLHCPRPQGRGRSAKRGRGGGERKAVSGFTFPDLRPSRALTTKAPAPARGPCRRASIVFVDGEGVPSPTPPRVISPRSGAWDDAGEEQDRRRLPGRPYQGISPALPPPRGGGGARSAGGVGEREEQYSGLPSQACALPGPSPRYPPLLRGGPGEGPMWFLSTGRGFPPRPLPW